MFIRIVTAILLATAVQADRPEDVVTRIPGFNATRFKVYSGYLTVPGPFELNSYSSLSIHYQFSHAQENAATKPVVAWHQGGPGGSSIDVGLCECPRTLVPHCVFSSCRP